MSQGYQVVFTSCPTQQCAEQIAGQLVTQKLAACVTMLPQALSVYEWEGEVVTDNEVLLLIKTTTANIDRLFTTIKAAHPYVTPELIGVSISQGSDDYLQWLDQITKGSTHS